MAGGGRFGPPTAPPGLTAADTALSDHLGYEAFAAGYVTAMRVSLLVSAAVLAVAALCCPLLKGRARYRHL
ncbi:hypothetical protein [Amycolatopsis minnesotensis]|uniref:Uncharacterized protein n=1 Tax=Amycolatopsis minnesotensis TaxID=337894 RepID=A0ABP5BLE5_9PSEU